MYTNFSHVRRSTWTCGVRPRRSSLGLVGPSSTLDLFDPFDHLDHQLSRNLQWIDRPSFLSRLFNSLTPRVPHKYRITVDCVGYSPKSIRTELNKEKTKLVVSAREGVANADNKHEDDDYSIKEFRRTYKLPGECRDGQDG